MHQEDRGSTKWQLIQSSKEGLPGTLPQEIGLLIPATSIKLGFGESYLSLETLVAVSLCFVFLMHLCTGLSLCSKAEQSHVPQHPLS